jgi:hypothetical protein
MNKRDCKHGQLARVCQICELEAENEEQARLLGMSGSREAKLIEELKQMKAKYETWDHEGMVMRIEDMTTDRDRWRILALKSKEALECRSKDPSCRCGEVVLTLFPLDLKGG